MFVQLKRDNKSRETGFVEGYRNYLKLLGVDGRLRQV